jgi:surfactin synthase thioesterase subunit
MPLTDLLSPWFPMTGARADATLRLICFPYAGGTPSVYRDWEEHLGDHVQVVPVLLPGRGLRLRERPYQSIGPLAGDIATALTEHGLTREYAMFGHSMGALLAYEVACELRERGEAEPRHLFVSGSRAPHLYGDRADHRLPDEALLRVVRDLGGLSGSESVGGAYLQRRLPVLRADLGVCENYRWRPRPPLGCPMTAFSATDDPIATPVQVEAWREYTSGSLLRRHLAGDHFYLTGASRHRLLRELRGELGRHRENHGADQDAPTRHPISRRTPSWTS